MTEDQVTLETRLSWLCSELVRDGYPLAMAMKAFRRKFMRTALDQCDGNVTRAARKLGIHRNTILHARVRKDGWRGSLEMLGAHGRWHHGAFEDCESCQGTGR